MKRPESVVPEPLDDNYDRYEYLVDRIRAIVRLIERDFAVHLGPDDGEWILETIEEQPETENDEMVEMYVKDFEIQHLTYNPPDLADYLGI